MRKIFIGRPKFAWTKFLKTGQVAVIIFAKRCGRWCLRLEAGSMENYFDVATPSEIREHFDGELADKAALANERDKATKYKDYNLELLAYLYASRKKYAEAKKYVELISDGSLRADTARMIAHDPDYLDWETAHFN